MSYDNFEPEISDPELEALFADLRNVPPRNPERAREAKEKYIAAVKHGFQEQKNGKGSRLLAKLQGRFSLASPFARGVVTAITTLVVIGVILFSGAGITAVAASNSLPGDRLFGVKVGIEQTRVQLTGEEMNKAQLNLSFAQRRLNEIEALIKKGRMEDLEEAIRVYETYIQRALSELERIGKNDLDRYPKLLNQIAASLKDFSMILEGYAIRLGGNGFSPFNAAIRFSESAGTFKGEIEFLGVVESIGTDVWLISRREVIITAATEIESDIQLNQLVEVEGWVDSSGNIYAKEIEKESNGPDFDSDDNEFLGFVNEIHPDYWIINGIKFERTSFTEIDGDIKVGDFVEVEFGKYKSGEWFLLEVELALDEDMDDEDEDEDDLADEDDDDDDDDDYDDDDDHDDDDDDDYDDDDDDDDD